MPPDPWDVPNKRIPGDQPLPKLGEFVKGVQGGIASAAAMGLYRWNQAKLEAIKAGFKPLKVAGGMGCMLACYGVLQILYGKAKGDELQTTVYREARAKATKKAEDHPDVFARSVEQVIRGMAGGGPGVYFFGLAVADNHTVTLAVDRAADGSHKMYWLDQNNHGLNGVVPSGQLGATLQRVQGYAPTTNIYAYRAR